MKEDQYLKKINELNQLFKEPSPYLKDRIINNSMPLNEAPKTKPSFYMLMIPICLIILAISYVGKNNNSFKNYLVNQNYVANFNLEALRLDNAQFIELELPENIDIVSRNKNILNQKKFIFAWSIFSDSKVVSFPFKANKEGNFNLKIKILNENMDIIGVKSMMVNIEKG